MGVFHANFTVIQVGANDGKTGDPIYHFCRARATRAVMIEPQPWLIDTLKANYAGSNNVIVENVAIGHPDDKELSFWTLKREYWADYEKNVGRSPTEIFSTVKHQLVNRIATRLKLDLTAAENTVEAINVPFHTLEQIVDKHGLVDLDFLQIDCEGYDFRVMQTLGETCRRVRFKVMRCRNKRVMPLAVRGPANRHPIRRWRG